MAKSPKILFSIVYVLWAKIFNFAERKSNRHSEGAERLWESPLLLLKVGNCHEPNGSCNDGYINKNTFNCQFSIINCQLNLYYGQT